MSKTKNQCNQKNAPISSAITKTFPVLLLIRVMLGCAAFLAAPVMAQELTQNASTSDHRREMIEAPL